MSTENPCFNLKRGVYSSSQVPADNFRLELNPNGFYLLPYHHLELVKFEAGDGLDTLTLSFLKRTVLITGKNLRDLGLALQDRYVEFRPTTARAGPILIAGRNWSISQVH